jgi:protein-tyrosine-phosphatase
MIRRIAPGRFDSFSAGVKPTGHVNPLVIRYLREEWKIDASDARCKSYEEFKDTHFDFVITVCDDAKETCPTWPGQPIVAHWGLPVLSDTEGTDEEKLKKIHLIALSMRRRLELFSSLPLEKLERLKLREAMLDIGKKS